MQDVRGQICFTKWALVLTADVLDVMECKRRYEDKGWETEGDIWALGEGPVLQEPATPVLGLYV